MEKLFFSWIFRKNTTTQKTAHERNQVIQLVYLYNIGLTWKSFYIQKFII